MSRYQEIILNGRWNTVSNHAWIPWIDAILDVSMWKAKMSV